MTLPSGEEAEAIDFLRARGYVVSENVQNAAPQAGSYMATATRSEKETGATPAELRQFDKSHRLTCIFCKGLGYMDVSHETAVLAERAVEAQRNDTRTMDEKIRDGVSFIMGPDAEPSSTVAPVGKRVPFSDNSEPDAWLELHEGSDEVLDAVLVKPDGGEPGVRYLPLYCAEPSAIPAPHNFDPKRDVACTKGEYAQLVYDARRYECLRDHMRQMPLGEKGTRHFFDQPGSMSFEEAVDELRNQYVNVCEPK